MLLFVFEFLGTTELIVILVVALVLFGPRKLPEIGRTVGKSLAEFKRATDDFKRTWEREVELERTTERARLREPAAAGESDGATAARDEEASAAGPFVYESENTIARGHHVSSGEAEAASPQPPPAPPAAAEQTAPRQEQLGKADWL
jgi:TatA/E family protein of Tat protein translocase